MLLKQRVLSSIGLWGTLLLVLLVFKVHGAVFFVGLFALMAQYEFSYLLKSSKKQRIFDVTLAGSFIAAYAQLAPNTWTDLLYALALILICNWSVFVGKTAVSFLTSLFCFWYITLNFHFFLKILDLFQWECYPGLMMVIWIVLVTKLTDVGGFFIGCAYGKHPLAPSVSPKKTWEGVGGGMAFALIASVLFFLFFKKCLPVSFTLFKCLCFTVIMAWGAIVSDLLESLLKRQLNTKDSGCCIPGIGGVLDLVDSLLLNAPLGYILLKSFL